MMKEVARSSSRAQPGFRRVGGEMVKVLEGVRILERGTFITGPAAAMFLAHMGADVVKIERPKTGDPFRAF